MSSRNDTYLWAVTRSEIRWSKIPLGSRSLADHVKALRCGARRRRRVAGRRRPSPVLNFCGRSRYLAMALACHLISCGRTSFTGSWFGQIADLIAGKQILVVASGPLATLPFHVLLVSDPAAELLVEPVKYAQADWLARHAAVSVLPSVASLAHCADFLAISSQLGLHRFRATHCYLDRTAAITGPGRSRTASGYPAAPPPPAHAPSRARCWQPAAGRLADVDELRHQVPFPKQQTSSAWLRSYWVRRKHRFISASGPPSACSRRYPQTVN